MKASSTLEAREYDFGGDASGSAAVARPHGRPHRPTHGAIA
jgi:hypothetical protein